MKSVNKVRLPGIEPGPQALSKLPEGFVLNQTFLKSSWEARIIPLDYSRMG